MATGSGTGTPISTSVNDYLTTAEFKAAFPDTDWGSDYDTAITRAITRTCRLVDRHVGRLPGAFKVTTDSTHYFAGNGTLQLWIGELADEPTSVSVAEGGVVDNSAGTGGSYTAWSASDYLMYPYNALAHGEPYQRLDIDLINGSKAGWYKFQKAVKIVGKFGYSVAVPEDVKELVINQVFRWFKRSQQAMTDVGVNAELGEFVYRLALDPQLVDGIEYLRIGVLG